MGRCKFCKKRGVFFFFNQKRLCRVCAIGLASERQRLLIAIKDPENLLQSSKKSESRLSQCDVIIKHAQALLEYEKKGISTLTPLPSEIIEKYQKVRRQIVSERVKEEVGILLRKARLTPDLKDQIAMGDEVLLKIYEARNEVGESPELDGLERQVTRFISSSQVDTCLEAARKAEREGDKKKCLDHYLEALHFLRKSEADDPLQQERIAEIKNKIAELKD